MECANDTDERDGGSIRVSRLASSHRDTRVVVLSHGDAVRRVGLSHTECRYHRSAATSHGYCASAAHAAPLRDRRRRTLVCFTSTYAWRRDEGAYPEALRSPCARYVHRLAAAGLLRTLVPCSVRRRLTRVLYQTLSAS